MYFGLVLNDRTLYLYIYYYINFAYTSARKILCFVSEDITDSVENNELTVEGNGVILHNCFISMNRIFLYI